MKLREKLAQFMIGRYGMDELSRFLLIATVVLVVLSWFLGGFLRSILGLLEIACLVLCYVRVFSRDAYKRQQENAEYLTKKAEVMKWFRSIKDRWDQRKDYCFFRCPSCKTLLRVPKNKGKLLLTCRKCGNRFERKT